MYRYLTKHYCPSDEESLFKKKDVKIGETRTLLYQLYGLRENGGILTTKISKADFVKCESYSVNLQQMDFSYPFYDH